MRVLHTSDWHLGQHFYEYSRQHEHQAFLDWLVETLHEQQIDLLLIAGDIYHTATPPASAEKQLYQFIKTAKSRCPKLHIVIIAGNHDSANRIITAKPLLAQFDTHVVGRFEAAKPEDVVLSIATDHGLCKVVAMPFLRAADLHFETEQPLSYNQAVASAYQAALEYANTLAEGPLIVMGHLHAKGGAISTDSERNLVIGGEDAISATIFGDHADYVALGHLHKAQQVAKSDTIRYCGTPLPMSFAERHYQHQVLLVEFSHQQAGYQCSVNPLYIPTVQPLKLLPEKGCVPLTELCQQISDVHAPENEPPIYLRVKLSSHETDTSFRAQIDEALKNKAVLFCGIERVREQQVQNQADDTFEDISYVESLNPLTLLQQAFANHNDTAGSDVPEQVQQLLSSLIDEIDQEDNE